jgi:outer membrane protein OmpA-like peptidoglycan-associated protein
MRTFLLLIAVSTTAVTATAQTLPSLRVLNGATPIVRWYPSVKSDVIATVEPGTSLESLGKEDGWYWVITPRDATGTRRAGWVAARDVEVATEGTASLTPEPTQPAEARLSRRSATIPPLAASNASAVAREPGVISADGGGAASERANGEAARKEYGFDDVHFALNRHSLEAEATKILDGAAVALKNDTVLRLRVEGYTCNLGPAAYNLALGDRRANAVKDYLMSKGVPADRLRAVSFGEDHAKYDNSHEQTRRLNRRVALVIDAQP